MKIKKELKRDTKIIMVAVLVLTVMTLSLSYSALFSVQTQTTVQKINTGTLSVVIDSTSTPISEDLLPTPSSALPTAADSVVDGKYATLSFTNNGTLNAQFALTLSRDTDSLPSLTENSDLLAFNYLNVGIFDTTTNSWVNFGTDSEQIYYVPVSSLTPATGTTDVYPILNDNIDVSESKQYRVYIWLAETTPADQIGKLVYLKLDVQYTTVDSETFSDQELALAESGR